jgi:hypothetical protein
MNPGPLSPSGNGRDLHERVLVVADAENARASVGRVGGHSDVPQPKVVQPAAVAQLPHFPLGPPRTLPPRAQREYVNSSSSTCLHSWPGGQRRKQRNPLDGTPERWTQELPPATPQTRPGAGRQVYSHAAGRNFDSRCSPVTSTSAGCKGHAAAAPPPPPITSSRPAEPHTDSSTRPMSSPPAPLQLQRRRPDCSRQPPRRPRAAPLEPGADRVPPARRRGAAGTARRARRGDRPPSERPQTGERAQSSETGDLLDRSDVLSPGDERSPRRGEKNLEGAGSRKCRSEKPGLARDAARGRRELSPGC